MYEPDELYKTRRPVDTNALAKLPKVRVRPDTPHQPGVLRLPPPPVPLYQHGAAMPRQVLYAAAQASGYSVRHIAGPDRATPIMLWRRACIVALRALFPAMSLCRLGRLVGKDHSTILHALRKANERPDLIFEQLRLLSLQLDLNQPEKDGP